MDEGDDEYVDPNLYSAFGVDSVLNIPASPIRESPPRVEDVDMGRDGNILAAKYAAAVWRSTVLRPSG